MISSRFSHLTVQRGREGKNSGMGGEGDPVRPPANYMSVGTTLGQEGDPIPYSLSTLVWPDCTT